MCVVIFLKSFTMEMKMQYFLKKLDNGIRVITTPVPTSESATITVWVGVGSRSEENKIAGLSHFIEHIVFKGSKAYPSAKAISETIDALGAEVNAGTSKEWTNFYIKTRSANLPKAFDVLSDMVLNPLLDEREIEREKGVIIEEIAMYEDTPLYKIGDVFENLIFKGDSLGRDISGSKETVKSLKKDDFVRYREIHYYSDNIVISVAGGVERLEVERLAERYFTGLAKRGPIEEKAFKFTPKQDKPAVFLKTKKNQQAHFILGVTSGQRGNPERYIEAVLSSVLGGGMSSRLFVEIRERRGLAYSVKTSIERYVETGELATYAGVETGKIDEAVKVMLDQYYGLGSGEYPLPDKELLKAKEYLKGHLALSFEDSKEINNLYGESELMLGKINTLEEVFSAIDKVSGEDVIGVAKKLFVPGKMNLAIIGPYNDQAKFLKLLEK
jgi:predicted Zn-dependent peptidase